MKCSRFAEFTDVGAGLGRVAPEQNGCAADDHQRAAAAKIFCARHLSAAGACVGSG